MGMKSHVDRSLHTLPPNSHQINSRTPVTRRLQISGHKGMEVLSLVARKFMGKYALTILRTKVNVLR